MLSFQGLIRKTVEVRRARKSGDPKAIKKAIADRQLYRILCLKATDEELGITKG